MLDPMSASVGCKSQALHDLFEIKSEGLEDYNVLTTCFIFDISAGQQTPPKSVPPSQEIGSLMKKSLKMNSE